MIKTGDYVRVQNSTGVIEGVVFKVEDGGGYRIVYVNTGFRIEKIPDDIYSVEFVRVALPEEPTELGAVYTRDNVDYVRWTDDYLDHWVSSVTGLRYTWKEIND